MLALMLAATLRTAPAHPHPLTTAPPRIARAARNAADLSAKRRAVPRRAYLGEFVATAYSYASQDPGAGSSDWCANGMRVGVGRIAVDRRVIPLYTHGEPTRLYVEGYGECIAADTGGAIKGHRIDVFLPTNRACNRWGKRTVKVWRVER